MTRDQIDALWQQALHEAVQAGEQYTRYHFAALIAAAEREDQWIDPNDKTKAQFLPHIGEPVLFCHGGVTYYGKHTGGSFQAGRGVTSRSFDTWDCHWMYPPAAIRARGQQ